jgi:gluconate 5-dehydrogenase
MGARVAITSRKADELEAARQILLTKSIQAVAVVSDLADVSTIEPMVSEVLRQFGHLDILVNNAGTTWGSPAEEHPLDKWRKVIDLNLTGTFVLTKEIAVRSMIPRCYGRIINIASAAGLLGSMDMQAIAYHTSKGGLVNFTRALAGEWGHFGIAVNAICPGYIPTKMSFGVLKTIAQRVIDSTPLRQMGEPEDLQGLVILLAGQAARHITGQVIVVDGGRSAVR